MARGSDASASAAVLTSVRLRRTGRSTNENLKNIAPTLLQSAAAPGFLGQLFGWQQDGISDLTKASPTATTPSQHLPQTFFARPAEQVAPKFIGCLLVKYQEIGTRNLEKRGA